MGKTHGKLTGKQLEKLFEAGSIDEQEKFIRAKIIAERIAIYQRMSGDNVLRKPFYYFVVYDKDKTVIKEIITNGISSLLDAGMNSHMLDNKELAVFLKYTFTDNFEETDVEMLSDEELMSWVKPTEVIFKPKHCISYLLNIFLALFDVIC